MKTRRLPTRDVHEDRCEREEKLGHAADTMPGKTLRDRTATNKGMRSIGRREGTNTQPAVPHVVIAALLPNARSVRFSLSAPEAAQVSVAGSFNDWHPSATPLAKSESGEWQCEEQLQPGEYEYRFVVDGVWQEDPSAKRALANPYGGFNSVITVS